MSVYSGFSTRKLETKYGKLLTELVTLLALKVNGNLNHEDLQDLKWIVRFEAVYRQMQSLEGKKYLPPKYSPLCKHLYDTYALTRHTPCNERLPRPRFRVDSSKAKSTNKTPKQSRNRSHYEKSLQHYLNNSALLYQKPFN